MKKGKASMRRSVLARALIAILLLPLVAACAGAPSAPAEQANPIDQVELKEPVQIALWHTQTQQLAAALQGMVDEFNQTNGKGITVKLEFQGNYTQLYQKNLAAITAGALPETAVAYESFVADYMKADVVVDLDPYVSSTKHGLTKESVDDIYKPYFDTNRFPQFGNKLLSFPFTKSLAVMYTSDDILKEIGAAVPRTWEEFETVGKAAKKVGADGKVTRWGWAVPTDASYFDAMVLAMGGRLMSEDNKTVAWDGKEGLQVLQLIDRSVRDGWGYNPPGFDWQNDFGSAKLLFSFQSSTGRPFVRAAMKNPSAGWSIRSIPQLDPTKPKTVQFGANVTVFKSTPEKQLASWHFIKWFTEAKQTARWAVASSYMPVRKSASSDAALQASYAGPDRQGKEAFDLIGTSIAEPNVRGHQDIRTVITDMITKVITQRATPDQAIKEAGTKANQILKDNQ
jgi:multiple sugar transport system substrate-binding protein